MASKENSGGFATRWGLVLAAIGMAVGTGNIWRFPRMAAKMGGGSFIIGVVIAMILWAVPLLIAESVWGNKTRMGCGGSFKKYVGEGWTWAGTIVGLICAGIAFYYAVVLGWCFRYLAYGIQGVLKSADSAQLWETFSQATGAAAWNMNGAAPWHLISMIIVLVVTVRGIEAGVEKICKVLIPLLFLILTIIMVRAVTLPGATEGLKFLFQPDWDSMLTGRLWIEAFTQAAWSTGAGWGLMLTYFIYTKSNEDTVLNATTVCFGDTSAGLLAVMCVVPTIFALDPNAAEFLKGTSNNGLVFVHLVTLFQQMPAGQIIGILFFMALTVAALSSTFPMLELVARFFMDAGFPRKKALLVGGVIMYALGVPSAMNINFLDNQDWVWGVGLLVSGLFFSLAAIKMGVDKIWKEDIEPNADLKWPWLFKLIYLFPLWFVLIFGWWIYQAASWYPGEWWKFWPAFDFAGYSYNFSPGTIFFQWAILFVVVYALKGWFNNKFMYQFDPQNPEIPKKAF